MLSNRPKLVIVLVGGVWFIYRDIMTVADLVAFVLYVGIIITPLDRLINFIEYFQQGIASLERFEEVMQIEPDITDKTGAYCLPNVAGMVEMRSVSFKYSTSTDWIVRDISITIKPGEKIALVGESGAGKTSLVGLIPRFYEPQQGQILLDGHNVNDLQQKFIRENVGLVQQNSFLFDETIRENILYGNFNATDEQVIEAAKNACIYDFIMSLPEGFDTPVGERGIKLSGGQKQRIAVARVFLKNPPILIFDEATSSLDSESEHFIQQAMERLCQNRTTIVIAHRLSTVKHVDRIYVLKKGEIIETGSHDMLIGQKGYYWRLYSRHML